MVLEDGAAPTYDLKMLVHSSTLANPYAQAKGASVETVVEVIDQAYASLNRRTPAHLTTVEGVRAILVAAGALQHSDFEFSISVQRSGA